MLFKIVPRWIMSVVYAYSNIPYTQWHNKSTMYTALTHNDTARLQCIQPLHTMTQQIYHVYSPYTQWHSKATMYTALTHNDTARLPCMQPLHTMTQQGYHVYSLHSNIHHTQAQHSWKLYFCLTNETLHRIFLPLTIKYGHTLISIF